jgi:hypothetical protein
MSRCEGCFAPVRSPGRCPGLPMRMASGEGVRGGSTSWVRGLCVVCDRGPRRTAHSWAGRRAIHVRRALRPPRRQRRTVRHRRGEGTGQRAGAGGAAIRQGPPRSTDRLPRVQHLARHAAAGRAKLPRPASSSAATSNSTTVLGSAPPADSLITPRSRERHHRRPPPRSYHGARTWHRPQRRAAFFRGRTDTIKYPPASSSATCTASMTVRSSPSSRWISLAPSTPCFRSSVPVS